MIPVWIGLLWAGAGTVGPWPKTGKAGVTEPRRRVDVDALFATPPGEGQIRCRSVDPDIVYVAESYVGGPVPPRGMLVQTTRWFLDGEEVATIVDRAGEPAVSAGPFLRLTEPRVLETVRSDDPVSVVRNTETGVLVWSDGSPVVGDATRVELTWMCEWAEYPARP
ncbi:MAG: hypothetical protein R3F61_02295 [Myxococcota bacterium]